MVAIANSSVTDQGESISPLYGIIFYGNSSTHRGGPIVCATKHRINNDQTLSVGQLISERHLKAVGESLARRSETSKQPYIMPRCVLIDSETTLAWHRPRFLKNIWFRMNDSVKSYFVEWPPLLYAFQKKSHSLRVFALGANARPDLNTRLYHAPLMNINDRGFLCQGSAQLPRQVDPSCFEDCEATLIDSQFSHINHKHTLKGGASDAQLVRYWRSKSGVTPKRVMSSELKYACRLSKLFSSKDE